MFAHHYACLRAAQWPPRDEATAFDTHVLACILATGLAEAEAEGIAVTTATGLDAGALVDILTAWFPLMPRTPFALDAAPNPAADMEEGMVRDLLLEHRARPAAPHGGAFAGGVDMSDGVALAAGTGSPPDGRLSAWLAAAIARRAMKDDHLWQDLGLFERPELGRLIARHFPALHAGNTQNMRWKKYFYRRLCEAEGFVLCTAPSCAVCTDFADCFGAEDGMSRIAQVRREVARAA
ncbi:nitrogen fixation protein NifQ [Prosthecodimorpha staleyi]|uniref:Nitrogen fixation protein NifQ n=1 Tax=Prosthecodimorpha staleyi TaxID=2840188 RepID=A0A947D1H4_9HYPH|nr:nitrogen fixation protein NifQ [Prosthecodimorpha staleyi]MBT9288533.1 nitrogen fixation protein NifQ [Prosthecodimorpha staleyi]